MDDPLESSQPHETYLAGASVSTLVSCLWSHTFHTRHDTWSVSPTLELLASFLGVCSSPYLTHSSAHPPGQAAAPPQLFSDHPGETPLLFYVEHVLICLLGGKTTRLRSTGQQISLDHLCCPRAQHGPAQSRYAKNILNLFVDEEIEARSWDLMPGLSPKLRNLGTTLCCSLSCCHSWQRQPPPQPAAESINVH